MEGLITFLLFGALFFVMMRFGCGAHVHGGPGGQKGAEGHAGHGHGGGAVAAKDPVCGMQVAEGEGYTKAHGGRTFRFCSRRCLDQFESNPERYVATEGGRS